MDLYDAGIVNGASATMFYPENNVTRAEFTKMAVVLFGLDSKSTESQSLMFLQMNGTLSM